MARAAEAAVGAPASEDEAVAVSRPAFSSDLPPLGPRVIQTASLRVSVARGRFEEAAERARAVAAGLGGFVASSAASQGDRGRLVRGTLVLRVPARSYAQAMAALARLGRVEGRAESGQDVSHEFVDLEARVRHLEAVETQLLELLERARTVAAALAVQSQLNAVQLELEQTRGRLRFLDDQIAFATISLELRERLLPGAGRGKDRWGILDAWREAAQGFVRVTGRVFVALATAAPILLLLGLALLAARFAIRRRARAGDARPAGRAG